MRVVEIHEPSRFWKELKNRRVFPSPVVLTRVKLKEDERRNHYLYIVEFGYSEVYYHDSATDYSGTGGRYKEEMDAIFKHLSELFNTQIIEKEMDFELYWKLLNMFYFRFTEGRR